MKYYASATEPKTMALQDWQDEPEDGQWIEVSKAKYERLTFLANSLEKVKELQKKGPSEDNIEALMDIVAAMSEREGKYGEQRQQAERAAMKEAAAKGGFSDAGTEKLTDDVHQTTFVRKTNNVEDNAAQEKINTFMANAVPIPMKDLLALLAFMYGIGDNAPEDLRGKIFRIVKMEAIKQHVEIEQVGEGIAVSMR